MAQPWTLEEEPYEHQVSLRFTIEAEQNVGQVKLALEQAALASVSWDGEAGKGKARRLVCGPLPQRAAAGGGDGRQAYPGNCPALPQQIEPGMVLPSGRNSAYGFGAERQCLQPCLLMWVSAT